MSKLTHVEFDSAEIKQAENFQKMALAMARDIRVILVKLADRLHNMRTLGALKPEAKKRIANETLDIYAPIATRLGMNEVRMEFEDLGLRTLYPMRARRIEAAREAARGRESSSLRTLRNNSSKRSRATTLKARSLGAKNTCIAFIQKCEKSESPFLTSWISSLFASLSTM